MTVTADIGHIKHVFVEVTVAAGIGHIKQALHILHSHTAHGSSVSHPHRSSPWAYHTVTAHSHSSRLLALPPSSPLPVGVSRRGNATAPLALFTPSRTSLSSHATLTFYFSRYSQRTVNPLLVGLRSWHSRTLHRATFISLRATFSSLRSPTAVPAVRTLQPCDDDIRC